MLQRVRDLAVQYTNGTLSTTDKAAIAAEVAQLATEIERIGTTTKFNGIKLLDGSASTVSFQVGANDSETITVTHRVSLGGSTASAPTSTCCARRGVAISDDRRRDQERLARSRDFGAVQNRLEHRLNNLATYQENLTASESRIRDVDMASEMIEFTKHKILQQAGTSMLAQANQAPQGVLSLLR